MTHDDATDSLGPDDERALADFVAVLRGATPPVAVLSPARVSLVGAPRRGVPWLRLLVIALALGTASSSLPTPAHDRDVSVDAAQEAEPRAPGHATVANSASASEPLAAPEHSRSVSDAAPRFSAARAEREEASEGVSSERSGSQEGARSARRSPREPSDSFSFSGSGSGSVSVSGSASVSGSVSESVSVSGSVSVPVSFSGTGTDTVSIPVSAPVPVPVSVPTPKNEAPPTTLVEDAPSALLADALRFVMHGRCDEAAPRLSRVVEGETVDSPARVEDAELALARCLFELGYVHTSAAVVDGIAQRGNEHGAHLAVLELLARLGERLPDPRGVVVSVGRYRADELDSAPPERVATLRFLLARARYDEASLDESASLFHAVPEGHRSYVQARYLEGITHVRRRRARPAIAAFEDVLAAVGTSRDGGSGERGRFRDLARLAIARVRYAAARPGREGEDPARQEALVQAALEAWQEIPFGSEAGLDAFFEESWALYLLGENARALGHVHGLLAPQLRERPHPEALVLRATIYFEHCRFDAAGATVSDFHARFDPLLAGLERVEAAAEEPDAAFRLLDEARSGRGPEGLVGEVVEAALDDREIARLLVSVRAMDAESDRLAHAPAAIRESSLGLRIAQELALARSFAVELASRLVLDRLHRVTGELRDRTNDIDTVALEIDTQRRRALESGVPLTREPERPVPIVAVQGDELWPFDGEYWEDELPYYRELVTSLCAR